MNEKKGKTEIASLAEKNRIIANIIEAMTTRDNFLLMGHTNPDEDCMAGMVAFGLLLSKMYKTSYLMICTEVHENYQYLLNICKFNSIIVLDDCSDFPEDITTIAFMDTAKPSMLMHTPVLDKLYADDKVLKIEFDHHLESDSAYIGDPGYSLVTGASSSCELVGLLACKLDKRRDVVSRFQINRIFSRNFVLAVLTGIIGDSQMGKYLKTNRERYFYRLFSNMFNDLLSKTTYKDSNFSDMKEVYNEIFKLSKEEEECYRIFMDKRKASEHIGYIVLDKKTSDDLTERFDLETIITIARTTADHLAEESGYISLICYYDDPASSPMVQFRMRRSQDYRGIDLRRVISRFEIKNGGGHAGAIGFRIDRTELEDLHGLIEELITGTEALIAGSKAAKSRN